MPLVNNREGGKTILMNAIVQEINESSGFR